MSQRIIAGLLSAILVALLAWTIVGGVGDVRTQVLLGVGAITGIVYTIYGRVPGWLIDHSGGRLVDDDDPSNISPRIYLPILVGTVITAVVVFVVFVYLL